MDKYFYIDKFGTKIKCELLFTFNHNDKDYIIYTDYEDDFLASTYKIINNELILSPINTEEEWNIIDKEIEKRYGQ